MNDTAVIRCTHPGCTDGTHVPNLRLAGWTCTTHTKETTR